MNNPTTGVEVFVTMVADRHLDPYPEVYVYLDDAIKGARAAALRHAAHPGSIREEAPPTATPFGAEDPHSWLFHIAWSTEESDSAWVVREEIR